LTTFRAATGSCIGLIAATLSLPAIAAAQTYDGPSFRKGLWRFERAVEFFSKSEAMPRATRIRIEPLATRCVDPTEAMKETFRPVNGGSCRSQPAQKYGNSYVFPLRCDYIGPVRTVITVESDSAYREVHELTVGTSPRKETIVARRLGDCDGYRLASDPPLQLFPTISSGVMTLPSADGY
jgi:Protein of unknown function (DUF3617)